MKKQDGKPQVEIKHYKRRFESAKKRLPEVSANMERLLDKHQKKQLVGAILWFCRKMNIDAEEFAKVLGLNPYLYKNNIGSLTNLRKVLKEMFRQKKELEGVK